MIIICLKIFYIIKYTMNFKKIIKNKFTWIVIIFVIIGYTILKDLEDYEWRLGNAKLYETVEGQQGAYGN